MTKPDEAIFMPWSTCLCPKSFDPDDYQGWYCSAGMDDDKNERLSGIGEGMSTVEAVDAAMRDFRRKLAAYIGGTPITSQDPQLARALDLLDKFHPEYKEP